ncbi:DUF6978 family protein [Runella aurantiaca]|uniref:Lj965 prophage protein n=1 Tax=Runella aurantiaca TaxID=2282308 RepID=A0A369I6J3_9BACT|nr:hypothetical protein [Runella aurantiaca]RDB04107.1 hypothetical protein DVG78_20195 [Runella aurantiaca]
MSLAQTEAVQLFDLKKYQIDNLSVNFPLQGQSIEIELQNQGGRIRFIADIDNANEFVKKAKFQMRYKKVFSLRRLDLNGNHRNPPENAPSSLFEGYENYVFNKEDHIHFYIEGYGERWALPLAKFPEIGIKETDDLFEKMQKFFKYCNVEKLTVNKLLDL